MTVQIAEVASSCLCKDTLKALCKKFMKLFLGLERAERQNHLLTNAEKWPLLLTARLLLRENRPIAALPPPLCPLCFTVDAFQYRIQFLSHRQTV